MLGRAGEHLAAHHLTDQGMTILARNWRCAEGELDLVLLDGSTLVVCEVKTRRSQAYGHPLEAITWSKAARLRQLAAIFARTSDALVGHRVDSLRLDAVGIIWPEGADPVIRHVRAVGA